MNNVPMTAKEYLSRAYRIDQRINAKLMRISELRALAQKCTVAYGGERVSHTQNVASLEDAVMKIMEAEKVLDAQIDLLVDTKKEIEGVIERVPDADCRLLLEMRYLAMKCWIDVAAEMNVCRAYVHRLHEKALGMVETILPRKNSFVRPAVANVDALVIFAANVNPITEPFLIDRVAAIAGNKGVECILCVNKTDLDGAE